MVDTYRTPGSGPKVKRKVAMTPAEHYIQAEAILEGLSNSLETGVPTDYTIANTIALAQVHATLATANWDVVWPRKWITMSPSRSVTAYDRLGNKVETEG